MTRENDGILVIAVVSVGLGILFLFPGLGILYFVVMIPVLIVLRSTAARISAETFEIDRDNPLAAPRSLDAPLGAPLRQQPASVILQLFIIFVSLIAATIAFGVTCTAGVLSTLVVGDALNINIQSVWSSVLMLLIPTVSLAAAISVFVFLFRYLIRNR